MPLCQAWVAVLMPRVSECMFVSILSFNIYVGFIYVCLYVPLIIQFVYYYFVYYICTHTNNLSCLYCTATTGASGNVATEDVVYMLNSMGIDTGINIDALMNAT